MYEIAIKEYYDEDNDGKHRLVYSYFGLAVYFGQCLEETLSIMLWTNSIFEKKISTNKELNNIIDSFENSKKTLGNLINEVKHSYLLESETTYQLENRLNERNYLIHKYFKQNISKFYTDIGRLEMIKYFCDFIKNLTKLDDSLKMYYSDYAEKLGLTEKRISELADEIKQQEFIRSQNIGKNTNRNGGNK